ncbi:DUF2235 domain-containing protein [Paracoccaceae bacterium GXU_MW_L88]
MSPRNHVILIDGTMSRLDEGRETNIGLLYKLLQGAGFAREQTLFYHPGIQGGGIRKLIDVLAGVGINGAIRAAYGALAMRYRPGDRIYLFGYSRGAYAVRSLAGMIGEVGLLKPRFATARHVSAAYRHYEQGTPAPRRLRFTRAYCHLNVPVTFIGVWDTVKALGLPYPILSRVAPMATEFHNHRLGHHITHARQALALDETRRAYKPVLWRPDGSWPGRLEQRWFPGAHSDVGGHFPSFGRARPLGNVSLNWMLEEAQAAEMILPEGWRDRFPADPTAPMRGDRRGNAMLFLIRVPREVGRFPSETIDPSVATRLAALPKYEPKADMSALENGWRSGESALA